MNLDLMSLVKEVPLPVETMTGVSLREFVRYADNTCPLEQMVKAQRFEDYWGFLSNNYSKAEFLKLYNFNEWRMPWIVVIKNVPKSRLKTCLVSMNFSRNDFLKSDPVTGFPLLSLCYKSTYPELKDFLNEMKFVKEDYLKASTDTGDFPLKCLCYKSTYPELKDFLNEMSFGKEDYLKTITDNGEFPLNWLCYKSIYPELKDFLNEMKFVKEDYLKARTDNGEFPLNGLFFRNSYPNLKDFLHEHNFTKEDYFAVLTSVEIQYPSSTLIEKLMHLEKICFCTSDYAVLRSLCRKVEYSVLSPFLLKKFNFKEIGKDLLDVPAIIYHLSRHEISLANDLFELEKFDRSLIFKQIEGTLSPFYWLCRHESTLVDAFLPLNVPDTLPPSLVSDSWLFWIARIDWISVIDNGWVENLEKKDILGETLDYMCKTGHFEFSRLVVKFKITVNELQKSNPEALYWCCKHNFDCLSSFDMTSRSLFETFDEKGTPFSHLCFNLNPVLNKIFDDSEELKISASDLLNKQGAIVPLDELMKYKGFKHMSKVLEICNLSRDMLLESDRVINICKNHPHCLIDLKDLLNSEDFMILKDPKGRSALSWLSEAPYLPEYSRMLPSSVESDIIGFIDTDSRLLDLFLESSVTKMCLRNLNEVTASQKFIVCLNHGCFEEAVYYWNKLKSKEIIRPSPFVSPLTIAGRDKRMTESVEAAKKKLKRNQLKTYEKNKEIEDIKFTNISAHAMKECSLGQSGEKKFVVAELDITVDFLNDLKIIKHSKLFRSIQPISKSRARLIFEDFDFTLREFLCSKGVLDRGEARFILKCILKEIAVLHSKDFQNLKISPDNIVFKKIGQDWDVSILISSNYAEYKPKNEAPDDIWSLGIVYVEMLTGKPCEGKVEMKDSVIEATLCNLESRKTAIEILSILENESEVELILGNKNLKRPDLHEVQLEIGKRDKMSIGPRIPGTEWYSGRIHSGKRWLQVHIKKASCLFELDVGLSIIHPNIRPFLGSCKDGDLMYLAYEAMENLGDIHDTNRSIPQVHDIIRDLGSAAQYLHKKEIVHGMISPASLYLKESTVFFGDFANSFVYVQKMMVRNQRSDCYRPLESFLALGSDLWSLGRIFSEFLGITLPDPIVGGSEDEIYDHWLNVRKKIKRANLEDEFEESRSDKLQRVLVYLLQEHPKHRIVSEEIASQ